jgi:hypothetical protein
MEWRNLGRNGMITQEKLFKRIEKASETELKGIIIRGLKEFGKNMIENNFEFLVDYLKGGSIYARLIGQYICKKSDEDAKLFLTKLRQCFNIKNVNIDETLKLIRDNTTFILKRCSGWDAVEIPLINNLHDALHINCVSAEYKYVNNWGYRSCLFVNKIVYNGSNVLWIEKDSQNIPPQYFVLKSGNIYGISYKHKFITIYSQQPPPKVGA